MSDQICVLCAIYHPKADTHLPDRAQTCAAGRRRLDAELLSVRSLYRRLLEDPEPVIGGNDTISHQLPMAPTAGLNNQPRVSGTRDRQLPIDVDRHDLTAGAQPGAVADPYADQTGRLSVATVLNEWVTGWHERYFAAEWPPHPDALTLIDWLAGIRLSILCEVDPALADFATELCELRRALRAALGELSPKPAVMWGVPCPRCDAMSQLVLDLDDPDRYRECTGCGRLLTEDEYKAWLIDLVERYRDQQRLARGEAM